MSIMILYHHCTSECSLRTAAKIPRLFDVHPDQLLKDISAPRIEEGDPRFTEEERNETNADIEALFQEERAIMNDDEVSSDNDNGPVSPPMTPSRDNLYV